MIRARFVALERRTHRDYDTAAYSTAIARYRHSRARYNFDSLITRININTSTVSYNTVLIPVLYGTGIVEKRREFI